MTLNVLIIEDEALASKRLTRMLGDTPYDINILAELPSVSATLKWWEQNSIPIHLIFSDIQLLDGLSFHIWESIKVLPPIIFTTAFDQYLLQAFKTQGIDYLLKPFMQLDLNKAIEKFLSISQFDQAQSINYTLLRNALNSPIKLLALYRNQYFPILSTDIICIYIEHSIIYLQTPSLKYTLNDTLQNIFEKLDKQVFYKINRQVIINKNFILKYHTLHNGNILIQMTNSSEFTLGKDKARNFKDWIH